jgi:SWIM zinc finger
MSDWSQQRVEQLAPDAAAVKAAQGNAKPAKWQSLGRNDRLLWGECQGSGLNPYHVRVDLIDVTYKCSCPSRKLPCKHTLALLLMMTSGIPIPSATPPEFVNEWSTNRAKRAEAQQAREAGPTAPSDPGARAKRVEKREARVADGLSQLQIWMTDIVSQGLAAARAQGPQFWAQMASRLVDAQAPGLARRVRALGDLAIASPEWQSELLEGLARLQLLIDAYGNLHQLPADLQAEIRTMVGWTQEQGDLREREGIRDRWQVIARRQFEDEQLRTQVTWLHGNESARHGLSLEFAIGSQPLPANFSVGQVIDASMVFFDGCPQLRVLEKQRFASADRKLQLPPGLSIREMQDEYARLLAMNPWLERYPVTLGPVSLLMDANQLQLQDASGRRVPVDKNCRHLWNLFALAAGRTLKLFGEWNGRSFDPYTAEHSTGLFTVARIGDLPLLSRVA